MSDNDLARIETELKEIHDTLARILDAVPNRKYYTILDICKDYGLSKSTVLRQLWMQPNYGVSDFDGREKRWLPDTYRTWFSVPPTVRKRAWAQMPHEERIKIACGV